MYPGASVAPGSRANRQATEASMAGKNRQHRDAHREAFTYTDGDAHNLLSQLVTYMEAFAGDHSTDLTVEDLVQDLVATAEDRHVASFVKLQDRIVGALDGEGRY